MFSLAEIDEQVVIFNDAADHLSVKADQQPNQVMQMSLRGASNGFREAAHSLERMVSRAIEAEARKAMKP